MASQLGAPVTLPQARRPTAATSLTGRTVSLVHLAPNHAESLFANVGGSREPNASAWTYMLDGPYPDHLAFRTAIQEKFNSADPLFFAIIGKPGGMAGNSTTTADQVLGYVALMCIEPEHLRLEIGHVLFSPSMQRTTAATEAIFLLLNHAFETLGYRRVEWRANALNERSRRAALRFGFVFEGIFRQHEIWKGRNWDTVWLSLLKDEWEGKHIKKSFELWLQPTNFDKDGRQKRTLGDIRAELAPG
ncbi:acyl-CoA N-acyltransferase [Aspergillus caelatus]|uniref:Acyl-CoA N-acyltransferase n=1 Tax=Aspergillus caelatus TaxID=61420 RepID=A0A5N7AKN9_9EURO|nr:acyl-CoA N-acyltransferase [Aspergillus caelatus]KAE8369559.1 acyl-CoA N-acyltransferase [Aspergillus caelatus]